MKNRKGGGGGVLKRLIDICDCKKAHFLEGFECRILKLKLGSVCKVVYFRLANTLLQFSDAKYQCLLEVSLSVKFVNLEENAEIRLLIN